MSAPVPAGATAGPTRGHVAGLGVALALSSAAGYVFLLVVAWFLTDADLGRFMALWSVLFGIGGALSILEQEAARRTSSGGDVAAGPSASAVAAGGALVAALLAAATMLPPVAARLYEGTSPAVGLVVLAAAVGFAVQFTLRGGLLGAGAMRAYGGLVVAEAAVRLVGLGVLAALAAVDVVPAAVAVALGSFAWLGWAARAHGVGLRAGVRPAEWSPGLRRAAGLMLAAGLTSALVTGYPALVTGLVGEATADVTGPLFAALTASRVPLLLLAPVQALTVPAVVRWRAEGAGTGQARLRRLLVGGSLAALATGLVAAAAAWAWGPFLVRLVFRLQDAPSAPAVALLVLGAFLLAWVLLLSAALVAVEARGAVVALWATGLGSVVVWLLVSPLDVSATTGVGALVAPVAAAAVAVPALWSRVAGDR